MSDSGRPDRPEWWSYPLTCPAGHPWAPGRVIVGWMPCDCPGAMLEPGRGHLWVRCRAAGCDGIWYRPEHSSPAGLPGPGPPLTASRAWPVPEHEPGGAMPTHLVGTREEDGAVGQHGLSRRGYLAQQGHSHLIQHAVGVAHHLRAAGPLRGRVELDPRRAVPGTQDARRSDLAEAGHPVPAAARVVQ